VGEYVTSGLKDGPLPTHYEPLESPVANALSPDRPTNPAADRKERPDNRYAADRNGQFPYVLTTYRMTEHHTAGGMTRFLPHLAELPRRSITMDGDSARDCRQVGRRRTLSRSARPESAVAHS
jgi:hypothetical protein